jgi:hypothetical protein
MTRTTASLLTGALAAGTFAVLATAAPSIASADSCGPTTVTQLDKNGWTFPAPSTIGGSTAEITKEANGLVLQIPANGRAIAGYNIGPEGVPLSEQTSMDQYALDGGTETVGFSYQLVMDLNRPASDGNPSDFAQLVHEPSAREGWYSTRPLPEAGIGDGRVNQEDTGTLQEISAAYPNAVITGFLLQLGQVSSAQTAVIQSVQFGCNVFEFDYQNTAPVAAFEANDAADKDYRSFAFVNQSTDTDGDALTYSWNFGDGSAPSTEANPTHRFPAGPGTYDVTLTATDARGASHTAGPWVITVALPAETSTDEKLAGTGADVMGLAALGALVAGGSAAGLVANRRRKAVDAA